MKEYLRFGAVINLPHGDPAMKPLAELWLRPDHVLHLRVPHLKTKTINDAIRGARTSGIGQGPD